MTNTIGKRISSFIRLMIITKAENWSNQNNYRSKLSLRILKKYWDYKSENNVIIQLNLENSAILQILSNYKKHTLYYNKYNTLIKNSDLFIWACLGICYHIRLTDPKNNKLDKTIAFWALDIAMDKFGNL